MRIKRLLPFIVSILFFQNAYTQTPANLSLKEILNIGETNYPLLKQKAFEITAAKKELM